MRERYEGILQLFLSVEIYSWFVLFPVLPTLFLCFSSAIRAYICILIGRHTSDTVVEVLAVIWPAYLGRIKSLLILFIEHLGTAIQHLKDNPYPVRLAKQ